VENEPLAGVQPVFTLSVRDTEEPGVLQSEDGVVSGRELG
jgi:hypothetical protein